MWQPPWDQTRVRYWKSEALQNEAIFSHSFWENKTKKTNNCGTLYLRCWWQATCDTNNCYTTLKVTPPGHQVFLMEWMWSFVLGVFFACFFFFSTRIEGTGAKVAARSLFYKNHPKCLLFVQVCVRMIGFNARIYFVLPLVWLNLTATCKQKKKARISGDKAKSHSKALLLVCLLSLWTPDERTWKKCFYQVFYSADL